MIEWAKVAERAASMFEPGVLGTLGAIANWAYVSVTQPTRPMKIGLFFCNVIVSFYVGIVAGAFIGADNIYRDGIILVCGFCAYPLLGLIEANFKTIVEAWLNKWKQ